MKILSEISYGKAISFDLFSDTIFRKELLSKASSVFRDLWNTELNDPKYLRHFEARLVPLNKDHPRVPRYDRFRPIVVGSPLVKLLESRFAQKLREYMIEKMFAGQVGFVPECGVLLNIFRAVKLIQKFTHSGCHAFGIFVDFSNAYNLVRHTKLFAKLKGILQDEEIEFIRAIYSRNVIRLGGKSFRPNVGVAQGSVISPYLFNVYIEDLFKLLIEDKLVPMDNIMAYADDILVICTGLPTLKNIIRLIEKWTKENGMVLNKKKSAIVEFLPRMAKSEFLSAKTILDVPIEKKYKYLGLWLNQKLNLDDQTVHIKKKCDFIKTKLGPVLQLCSLEYRRNLWEIFIKPLFEFTLTLYGTETSVSRKESVQRLLKYTFKSFTKISRTTSDRIIRELSGYDLDERSSSNDHVQESKWSDRSRNRGVNPEEHIYEDELLISEPEQLDREDIRKVNLCRSIPANGVELINLLTKMCPACNNSLVMNAQHLSRHHDVEIPEPLDLFRKIQRELAESEEVRVARLWRSHQIIQPYVSKIYQFLSSHNKNG